MDSTWKKEDAAMKQSEKQLKEAIIKSTKSIKKKYRDLHKERFTNEEHFREQFKPIIDPLDQFLENKERLRNSDPISKNGYPKTIKEIETLEHGAFDESHSPNSVDSSSSRDNFKTVQTSRRSTNELISLKSLDDCSNILKTRHHDSRFGIRKVQNKFKMGQHAVTFNDNKICVRNKNFKLTDGLRNLLFLKEPKTYTENDKNIYKQILLLTDTHKLDIDKISDLKNIKYQEIVKPLFKVGSGIESEYMELNDEINSEYTYWDDPNELVERLRLLISSKSAGHNAHNNEILSIVEELKEANIIF